MKIALMGAQNTGKSTLVENFIKQWPMYKKPEKTYRDLIKEQNIKLNKEADKDSQKAILNALVDEIQGACASENNTHLIFDRCTVDNIAYTLWHHAKDTPGFTREFVIDSQSIAALSLKYLDIIFYVPVRKEIPLVQRDGRETDVVFREEIDNVFDALVESYENNTRAFFPAEDCPVVIRLEGPPDMWVPQMRLYIKENGNCYGEEDGSLLDNLSNL
jgi:GTPase SAR1 family protein